MNTTKTSYPPLTTNDVFTLHGKPTVKMTQNPSSHNDRREEWVYYSLPNNTEERYFFQNGCLVNWEKKPM